MGKSYLCAVFKALLEFLGRKPNTSAVFRAWVGWGKENYKFFPYSPEGRENRARKK